MEINYEKRLFLPLNIFSTCIKSPSIRFSALDVLIEILGKFVLLNTALRVDKVKSLEHFVPSATQTHKKFIKYPERRNKFTRCITALLVSEKVCQRLANFYVRTGKVATNSLPHLTHNVICEMKISFSNNLLYEK
jgi:hypothetical protein